jgi:hypothetical protein
MYGSVKLLLSMQWCNYIIIYNYSLLFIIGGLEVACCRPLVPQFAGSHPAETVGFYGTKISSARLPAEGT